MTHPALTVPPSYLRFALRSCRFCVHWYGFQTLSPHPLFLDNLPTPYDILLKKTRPPPRPCFFCLPSTLGCFLSFSFFLSLCDFQSRSLFARQPGDPLGVPSDDRCPREIFSPIRCRVCFPQPSKGPNAMPFATILEVRVEPNVDCPNRHYFHFFFLPIFVLTRCGRTFKARHFFPAVRHPPFTVGPTFFRENRRESIRHRTSLSDCFLRSFSEPSFFSANALFQKKRPRKMRNGVRCICGPLFDTRQFCRVA